MGRVAQVSKELVNSSALLRLRGPTLGAEAVRLTQEAIDASEHDERVHSVALRPASPCLAGSDLALLHRDSAEAAADHFAALAHLCRTLGAADLPAVRPHSALTLPSLCPRSALALPLPPPHTHTHRHTHTTPPQVALLDGNLSGGSLGLSAHARFSIVADRTLQP